MSNTKLFEKKVQDSFIVAIKYNDRTNKFFIDFSNESGVIISVLITEGVAVGLSSSMNLKIMYG